MLPSPVPVPWYVLKSPVASGMPPFAAVKAAVYAAVPFASAVWRKKRAFSVRAAAIHLTVLLDETPANSGALLHPHAGGQRQRALLHPEESRLHGHEALLQRSRGRMVRIVHDVGVGQEIAAPHCAPAQANGEGHDGDATGRAFHVGLPLLVEGDANDERPRLRHVEVVCAARIGRRSGEIALRIVAGVLRPRDQVAPRDPDVEARDPQDAADPLLVERVRHGDLAQLHKAGVLHAGLVVRAGEWTRRRAVAIPVLSDRHRGTGARTHDGSVKPATTAERLQASRAHIAGIAGSP